MKNTAMVLRHLYPGADPSRDYRVEDGGAGPRIAFWDAAILGPQPAPEVLAAAEAGALAAVEAKSGFDELDRATLAGLKAKPRGEWTDEDAAAALRALVNLFK